MKSGFMGKLTTEQEKFRLSKIKKEDIRKLLGYLKPYRLQFIWALIAMLATTALSLLFPYLTKIAIDRFILKGNLLGLTMFSILFLLLYGLNWIMSYFQSYFSNWIGQKLVYHLRTDLFTHILNQSISFFQSKRKGEMVSRVIDDINTLSDLVSSGVILALNDFLVILGSLVIMFFLHARLTILSFITLPFIYLTTKYLGKKILEREAAED